MSANTLRILAVCGVLTVGALFLSQATRGPVPVPTPPVPVQPAPQPAPPMPPAPRCPNCPREPDEQRKLIGQAPAPGPEQEPAVDLLAMPTSARPRNVGGRDGAGLCVFTSIQYASWWQGEPRLKDFQAKMRQEPGGGYPDKVDKMIARYGPGTRYVQYEGKDPAIIELALRTGRVPCITWQANHMLCCVHLDQGRAAILDNNDPNRVQWFSRDQFLSKWTQGGGGWVVALLASPPPPPPRSPGGPRNFLMDQFLGFGVKRACLCPPGCEACKRLCDIRHGCMCPRSQPAPVPAPDQAPDLIGKPGMEWRYQGESWSIGGWQADRGDVESALADDSAKIHLTVIGSPEVRARVEKDMASLPELMSYRDRYHVQSYSPGDWEVQTGFVTTGKPTIYLQARDGRVLLRLDSYTSGADLASALRRADPAYKPDSDPSGGASLPISIDGLKGYLPWIAGGTAAAAALALLLRSRGAPAEAAAPASSRTPAGPVVRPGPLDDLARELGLRQIESLARTQAQQRRDP